MSTKAVRRRLARSCSFHQLSNKKRPTRRNVRFTKHRTDNITNKQHTSNDLGYGYCVLCAVCNQRLFFFSLYFVTVFSFCLSILFLYACLALLTYMIRFWYVYTQFFPRTFFARFYVFLCCCFLFLFFSQYSFFEAECLQE